MYQIASDTLASYRANYFDAVSQGTRRPYVLPWTLIPSFAITTFYLAIPHVHRPWVYRARWLVVAIVLVLNFEQMMNVSSPNVAAAYGAGMSATWGSMVCLNLLVWTRPQFEAARVICVKKAQVNGNGNGNGSENGHAVASGTQNAEGRVTRRTNGTANGAAKLHATTGDDEYISVWQRFPEHESFRARLAWSWDLVSCFRGAGWNWSVSAIPRPKDLPIAPKDHSLVDISSIPLITPLGYERFATEKALISNRVYVLLKSYLMLDFLTTFMINDPYAVLGPDHPLTKVLPLPWYLALLPAPLLKLYREVFSMVAILSAVSAIFTTADIVQFYLIKFLAPSRDIVWMYASTYGTFSNVFERGLAGMWGAWWHQTFRVQFSAPANWMVRNGYLKPKSVATALITMVISFLHSGVMHMSGSVSSMPHTKSWRPLAFFLAQAVGLFIQPLLVAALKPVSRGAPQWMCRLGNFLFTLWWLYLTAPLFVDDLAMLGLWLLEPVPFSIFRALGFGGPGQAGWRWDQYYIVRWHSGGAWWNTGLAI